MRKKKVKTLNYYKLLNILGWKYAVWFKNNVAKTLQYYILSKAKQKIYTYTQKQALTSQRNLHIEL